MKPIEAFLIRRALIGHDMNGQADALSGPLRRLAEHLASLNLDDRLKAWEAFRCGLPDPRRRDGRPGRGGPAGTDARG